MLRNRVWQSGIGNRDREL
uniref:Uncharacterized protein n=1 Tax=Rhizophora mucronata TaxID=61149 RepID=A0A2P2P3R6_RHIMU